MKRQPPKIIPKIPTPNNEQDNSAFKKSVNSSKRLTLTYVMLFIWISLAIFAILVDADLYALAVYFASGLPIILGYLWSETARPSISDASDIVKSINDRQPGRTSRRSNSYNRYNRQDGYNNYDNYDNYNNYSNRGYGSVGNEQYMPNDNYEEDMEDTNIFSEDYTISLIVNQTQLSTLMNIGYVDTINDKYTFKKEYLEQIKELINNSMVDPNI
jgi:hypothetical protein